MNQPSNNAAAGAQPAPLPVVRHIEPVNPPGHRRYIEWRWLHWDEADPSQRVQWLTSDGGPHAPDAIIYHSTVCPNLTGSSANWLSQHPTSGVSIHALANRDGSLTEIVPPMHEAYHAGYALPGFENYHALGIEIENATGNGAGDVEAYPAAQVAAAAYRVATWAFSFGIPMERIQPHKLVAVFGPRDPLAGQLGRKHDPVGDFPDAHFRALVQAWLLFFSALPESEHAHYIQGAPAPAAPVDLPLLGAPTISPAVFERVLRDRNSPILQEYTADLFYKACTQRGVNPAFALAITVHENGAGTTGVTAPLKNWGAVRSAENPGLAAQDSPVQTELGPFAHYYYWLSALTDWCLRVKGPKYFGSNPSMTLDEFLAKYAPASDRNNPAAYAAAVRQMMAAWQKESKL